MIIDIYKIIGILGLLFIIGGNFMISQKKRIRRRYTYPLLVIGGICLEIYSIYIGDTIFIVLQAVFIVVAIYGLIRVHEKWLKELID